MNDDIYKEIILENYENPKNLGKIAKPDYHSHELNPNCGDEIDVFIKEKDGKISDIKFEGCGCAISMASSSLFTESVKGKSLDEIRKMNHKDIVKILGFDVGATRMKCSDLVLVAIKKAIRT